MTREEKSAIPKLREGRLDPDLVLQLCERFDGYDGAYKALAEEGLLNPDTGRPFTKHALIFVAKKSAGYKAWRTKREKARKNTAIEFARIAKRMIATKKKIKPEKG